MKTCKELGWKVGDKFECIKSGAFVIGEVVELVFDDGTCCPKWKKEDWEFIRYEDTDCFKPLRTRKQNKYSRNIYGVDIDVYDVLDAWEVTCPAIQHAIKKLLMPGQRGSKDKLQDLKEAEQAIKRAIELEEG